MNQPLKQIKMALVTNAVAVACENRLLDNVILGDSFCVDFCKQPQIVIFKQPFRGAFVCMKRMLDNISLLHRNGYFVTSIDVKFTIPRLILLVVGFEIDRSGIL